MSRHLRLLLLVLVAGLLVSGRASVSGQSLLIEIEDAYATHGAEGWAIGTGGVRLVLTQSGGSIGIASIQDPVGAVEWYRGSGLPDSSVVIDGQRVTIGGALTRFSGASVSEYHGGVRLDFRYALVSPASQITDWYNRGGRDRRSPGALAAAKRVEVTRSYVAYPGGGTIEVWNTFHSTGTDEITLSDINVYTLAVRPGELAWINGLNATEAEGGPFTRLSGELEDGQSFSLGSDRRATEYHVPFFSLSSGDETLFGALAWSGSWGLQLTRRNDVVTASFGLPPFPTSLAAGTTHETPHAVFGVTSQALPEVQQSIRRYVELGLRQGRPLSSHVSYNTWFNYGTFTDEATMLAEMQVAASLGIEQFVLDAGWWLHINPDDQSDYARNWGNWTIDHERFPNGLGWLGDQARAMGLRFGIWVEPERVDLATVGQGLGPAERYLARSGGRYLPGSPDRDAWSAQVCLADRDARRWATTRLLELIDEARPDYIVWDNNLWVNCDRPGHGHGGGDGNFRHHQALGTMLDEVRARYPDLEIENCATGGNRLSLDLVARSETAWVDDRTEPSTRVRHSFGGMATLYPPAYLLSFALTTAEGAGEVQTADAHYVLRSRMVGSWGFSLFLSKLDEAQRAEVAGEIAKFKTIRPILLNSTAVVLGQQAPAPGQAWSGWDAIQYLTPGAAEGLLMAYGTHDAAASATVRLKGLRPDVTYSVTSLDAGLLGMARGVDLMGDGITVQGLAGAATGHTLILRAEPGAGTSLFRRPATTSTR